MTPINSPGASAPLLRDIRTTSHDSGSGVNITEAEFNRMKASGQLDSLFEKYGEFSFKDLDTDRNGKINEYDVGSGRHSDRHAIRTGGNKNEGDVNSNSDGKGKPNAYEVGSGQDSDSNSIKTGGSENEVDVNSNSDGKGKPNAYEVGSGQDSNSNSIGTVENENEGDVKSNSDGKVVLQFAWSDTDTSKVDSALKSAGIDNFKRSDSNDKGLGIAVATKEQAQAFADYAGEGKKVFANMQEAKEGLDSTDDLKVSFSESSGSGEIGFGGKDYGGIVTDDPSKVVSGSAIGEQKGDDALWSTDNGNSAEVKMYGGGGRQYVTMDVDMSI